MRMDPIAVPVRCQPEETAGVLLLQRHSQDCVAGGAGVEGAGPGGHDSRRATRVPAAWTQEEPSQGPPLTGLPPQGPSATLLRGPNIVCRLCKVARVDAGQQ